MFMLIVRRIQLEIQIFQKVHSCYITQHYALRKEVLDSFQSIKKPGSVTAE